MVECNKCGDDVSMPYECNRCGDKFCSDHRLPEKHDCQMLDRGGTDAGVVVEVEKQREDKSGKSSILPDSLYNGKLWDKLDGQVTKVLGFAILGVYILQFLTLLTVGENIHDLLFVLEPNNVHHVWTWVTSIFAHSPAHIFHIIGNGLVLIFFGRLLERIIGSRDYFYLFIVSGIIAGLSQVTLGYILGNPSVGILGASGALLAILGVLTVYKPKMTVYLYFLIPVPLWVISIGFSALSLVGILTAGGILGGMAHGAHLVGLIVGLIYGYRTKDRYKLSDSTRLGSRR